LGRLGRDPELRVNHISSVYESAAVGPVEQPDFLNLAVEVETSLDPSALLRRCLSIEAALGRVREQRWGPRTIDIDLLWYAGQIIEEDHLHLPHPRMTERAFVLVPLAEIAPEIDAGGRTVRAWASSIDRNSVRPAGRIEPAGGGDAP
jgi:2-amino-4-hydroxy-6-hydroxymethyldihydropteridine diphosphokinase